MVKARILPPEDGKLEVNPDGTFSFELLRAGSAHLWFSGVAHKSIYFPIYSDSVDQIELDIVLESAMSESDSGPLYVTGTFNDFSPTEGLIPMVEDEAGIFSVTIESPADTFAYQLLGLEESGEVAMASPQADFFSDHGRYTTSGQPGTFASVVYSPRDSIRIEFKPESRIRRNVETVVDFSKPESKSAKLTAYKEILSELLKRKREAVDNYMDEATGEDFSFDDTKIREGINELIDLEEDTIVKHSLMLDYFESTTSRMEDSLMVEDLLTSLSPTSSLWASRSFENLLYGLSYSTKDKAGIQRYRNEMRERHPRARVRSSLLASDVRTAHSAMEEERKNIDLNREVGNEAAIRFSELYDRLLTEYPDSYDAKDAIKSYAGDRKIQVGNMAPKFSIASIENENVLLGSNYFQNKVWIIDFWAIACGPCITEMQYLHEAYDRFKDKGLNILSLSFDEPTVIDELREKRWPMPWYHGSLEDGFYSEISKIYDLVAIPRKVLVDENGIIIALDGDLRGDKLMETLESFFTDPIGP